MEISGITTVLPVVIPPNFTTGFHWHTTGNTADSRNIFYGEDVSSSCFVFNSLPPRIILWSADNLCKQFGPRSGQSKRWA